MLFVRTESWREGTRSVLQVCQHAQKQQHDQQNVWQQSIDMNLPDRTTH